MSPGIGEESGPDGHARHDDGAEAEPTGVALVLPASTSRTVVVVGVNQRSILDQLLLVLVLLLALPHKLICLSREGCGTVDRKISDSLESRRNEWHARVENKRPMALYQLEVHARFHENLDSDYSKQQKIGSLQGQ